MNTSKQVNVMIGLLMVGAIATLLYFLWDRLEREADATERQLTENAERGGALFAPNCSSCHGLTGKGALERAGLPGAPLNLEENRPTTIGELTVLHRKFMDTIACGRVGTLMPAWSTEQGGSLNEFQIQQLVALITGTMPGFSIEDNPDPNRISEEGWARALEEANHAAEFDPPKELAEAITANSTTLLLNDAKGLAEDAVLRIDDEPEEEGYELVVVTAVAEVENEIEVERATSGTEAVDHEEGAHVFQGPIPPPSGPLTGESGTPPCGQLPAAPAATPGPPLQVSGTVAIGMGDNFFDLDGQRNPNLAVNTGASITVELTSIGTQPHNMRTTGADGEFDNDDDAVSDPDLIPGGGSGTLTFSFTEAGTYEYRCDFHPDQMRGEIAVAE